MRSHRMPFFWRIRKRICDLRLYEFFTAGKTQNPKTDFWLYKVRAQQEPAPGAQHILYGRFENHGGSRLAPGMSHFQPRPAHHPPRATAGHLPVLSVPGVGFYIT